MNKLKILNTVDYSNCKKSLDVFNNIAQVDEVKDDYESVYNVIDEYDAYISSLKVKFDKKMILKAKRLKVIGTPSTGTDHLDIEQIKKTGIECFSIAKEFNLINSFTATSELAFALLLMLNRKLSAATSAALNGDWWKREKFSGFQLNGKTFGVLGLGRLGKISAKIANGFNMKVIFYDIKDIKADGVDRVSLKDLFERSDVLSIHIHLNNKTNGLVNYKYLSSMKNTSILINTSRGAIINEADLLKALEKNIISGAVLDIIDGEWNKNISSHPLIKYARENENLLITPHIGGATKESIEGARDFIAKKIADYMSEKLIKK